MTDHIDTRNGWREVPAYTKPENVERYLIEFDNSGDDQRMWVREEPVPPLPTIPYTVIRVTWLNGNEAPTNELAFFGGDWIDVDGEACTSQQLMSYITGFEVLAEPYARGANLALIERVRRETAKAVLDRVERDGWEASPEVWREFGVSS